MSAPILQPGRNCWRIDRAHRFYAIQDAAEHFRRVRGAVLAASQTVFMLGWDMTAGIDLEPGADSSEAPTRFDEVLAHAVRRRKALHCYLLTWDYHPLFALERDPFSRFRLGWALPRRVHFEFDDRHPVGGCHHQKVVVVDDRLAFSGSTDLTSCRWDTSDHRPDDPLRRTPMGATYGPYHEVQALVDGPVAASLGVLVRERWRAFGVTRLPPVRPSGDDLWPLDVAPDFTNVDVAISRTMPAIEGRSAVRECEALFLDAIAAARRVIYIENQYFTNSHLLEALLRRLAEPDGPEVVLVVPRDSEGWLEQETIRAWRDDLFARLVAGDTYERLRLVAPMASRAGDVATFVHSKVMLVDDEFVRIGSANCTHRSMGVDTECDLSIEARGDERIRAGIVGIRDRLLSEHLGLSPDTIASSIGRAGSLRALLDERARHDRTLVRIELPPTQAPIPSDALRWAADPEEPIRPGRFKRRWSIRSALWNGVATMAGSLVYAGRALGFRAASGRREGGEFD